MWACIFIAVKRNRYRHEQRQRKITKKVHTLHKRREKEREGIEIEIEQRRSKLQQVFHIMATITEYKEVFFTCRAHI